MIPDVTPGRATNSTKPELIQVRQITPPAPEPEPEIEGFASVDLYQRREKIFTRAVSGRFQKLRLFSGWPLLLAYFLTPWLQWSGRQAVLFDLPARKFYVFGVTFWPQDFMLLAWLLAIAAFALFAFTSWVGRVWCGYSCPQTVWTAIFMWIEQVTEGSRNARIKLDKAPWSAEKLRKRSSKHLLWLAWAIFTGVTFVGYFTPIRELLVDTVTLQTNGWTLFWSLFFAAATYFNAGWLREQVCIYMCPYARFQSAMIDKDTLIVSYDVARGEPRGARKRNARSTASTHALGDACGTVSGAVTGTVYGTVSETAQAAPALGDCIDCQLCVQVCPTGIDIRDGLQYQCIGCAHCIDACDQVMEKMGYAPGLVSYTTENRLAGKPSQILRPRLIGYALAMLVMSILFTSVLLNRNLIGIDVVRARGTLFQLEQGVVSNQYQLKLINKTQQDKVLQLALQANASIRLSVTEPVAVAAGEIRELNVTLSAPQTSLSRRVTNIEFQACDRQQHCDRETSRFFGPE